MNWALWTEIEAVLDKTGIKPILAIVPDNKDAHLELNPPRTDFWNNVRNWKEKGWAVGLHGYQHLYETMHSGVLRLNDRSEFAGLSYDQQFTKLNRAIEIFRREEIEPDVWVAPAHSFDRTTVQILQQLGLRTISDGLSRFPYRDSGGLLWVPQQLWRFRNVPAGVWTVCFHHNHWTETQLIGFVSDMKRFRSHITSLAYVSRIYANREITLSDRIGAAAMFGFIRLAGCYDRLRKAYCN
jgi:predicted deacetylase